MRTKPLTTVERVKRHNEKNGIRKVPVDGATLDRLAAYQKRNGLTSRAKAIALLLDEVEA